MSDTYHITESRTHYVDSGPSFDKTVETGFTSLIAAIGKAEHLAADNLGTVYIVRGEDGAPVYVADGED